MPNTKSAIKAARQNIRRRANNLVTLEAIRKSAKTVRKATAKKDANEALSAAFAALDKAAKKGVIHKNTANRRKSRLARSIAKLK